MLRRVVGIVLIVLGLSTIGAAVASGTVWRPDDRVTLTLGSQPDVPLVLVGAEVLAAVDDSVDIRLVGAEPDSPVILAIGQERDVRAWVADAPHWEITGLQDWETLTHESVEAAPATEEPTDGAEEPTDGTEEATDEAEEATEAAATAVPNPAGSDLWIEETTGTGELTRSWTDQTGPWLMLIASDGTAPAPQVELTWDREVATPLMVPGIIVGSVVTVLGAILLILQLLVDREKRRTAARVVTAESEAPEPELVPVAAGDRPLTRRELRTGRRQDGSATTVLPAPGADPEPDRRTPSAPEPEGASPEAPEDSAEELAAWVRTGSATPMLGDEQGLPPEDLAPVEPSSEAAPAADEPDRPLTRRERRLQQRAAESRAPADAPPADALPVGYATAPTWGPSSPWEPPAAAGSDSETAQIPAVGAEVAAATPQESQDPHEPQVTAASWRQAWGLPATEDGEPTPGSDEEGRR